MRPCINNKFLFIKEHLRILDSLLYISNSTNISHFNYGESRLEIQELLKTNFKNEKKKRK